MAKVSSHGITMPGITGNRVEKYAAEAKELGSNLNSLEKQLIKAYEKGADPGTIEALQIKYKAAQRLFESFMQMLKNIHETLMQVIRMMAVRG